ncbi:HTH-type transcriptional activator RhaS [Paenibacillus solanacearum]|uniref:HTH-type transcriptional activator RhaS n=1 Tax=Paenibacillus solanacearum TaxID=2048548 RepID=A0A916JXP4_9BACL|nr:AraC family transcriptional regulator [Paenibacillus solanacearum]CAG7608789.1 HTH-type transcriptional activator RhaS [Paenibacillus solanacearum]
MRHEFFERFFPKIVDVLLREEPFWLEYRYAVDRKPTNRYNFTFVSSGHGTVGLNGTLYELSAGAVYHLAPGEHLQITTTPEAPLRYYSVQFIHHPVEWEGMQLKLGQQPQPLPFERSFSLLGEMEAMQERMKRLIDVWDGKEAGFEWIVRLHFLNLLQWLCDWLDSKLQHEDQTARLIMDSMQYIREHHTQQLEREKLARMASLSPSYYSKMFKRYSGYTPMEYMNKVRLDQAKQLLRSSREPISKIAREVGFQDPLYFTRLFAREIGMSPRHFRNG